MMVFVQPARATPGRPSVRSLAYQIRPVVGNGVPRCEIDVDFAGDASGHTKIVLPSEWAGEENLFACVRNLSVAGGNAVLSDTAEPTVKAVTHMPGAKLRIHYDLVQDAPGAPRAGRGAGYRPVLQPEYFQWIGHSAWVLPMWGDDARADITLDWRDVPEGWSIENSFGANQTRQRFRVPLGDFEHAVFAGGDFRLRSTTVRGKPVYVAVRGAWSFSDDDLTALVGKIVTAEREFWRDFDHPYYVITVLPLDRAEGEKSIGGTGLTTSFATFMTTNATLDEVKWLFAHEYFHNWNSQRTGRLKEPQAQLYWFSEGFTDYYTYVLLLRANLMTFEEFTEHYNEILRSYYLSPARSAPNERVIQEFFQNEAVSKQPYWRGALLATAWDARIRKATNGAKSLDDVLRDMFAAWKRDPNYEVTADVVDSFVSRYTGASVRDDVRRFIEMGETIDPVDDLLGPCARREEAEIATFDLGFDLDALKTKKEIADVRPDSAAYAAGVRNGQSIVRRKPIYLNDPTHEVEITIKDGDGERTITYYPKSPHGPKVPQYRLEPANPAARCPGRFLETTGKGR